MLTVNGRKVTGMTKQVSSLEELSKELEKRNDIPFYFLNDFKERPIFRDSPNVHVAVGLMPSEFTSDE